MKFYIVFSVVTCPAVSAVSHAHVNSSDVEYGSVVLVSCHIGYEFSDDVTSLTLECTATGTWSIDIGSLSCSSTYEVLRY